MFTGIITNIGKISKIEKSGDWILTIKVENFTDNLAIGASIACNGVCLTVIEKDSDSFTVQASNETLALTTVANWQIGTNINLERALKVGDELGGHFVSGHVDGLATLTAKEQIANSYKLNFSVPANLSKFIVKKGSVTLNGVSLTVNEAENELFSVNIIPHTLVETNLGDYKLGDKINLEIDVIARYLAKLK